MPQAVQEAWALLVGLLPNSMKPFAAVLYIGFVVALGVMTALNTIVALPNQLSNLSRSREHSRLAKRAKSSRNISELNRIAATMAGTPVAVDAQGRKEMLEHFHSIQPLLDKANDQSSTQTTDSKKSAVQIAIASIDKFCSKWPGSDLATELVPKHSQFEEFAGELRIQSARENTARLEALRRAYPEMVSIPPGVCMIPSPNGSSQRELRIVHAFEIGKYPVTFGEWRSARAAGANIPPPINWWVVSDSHPVLGITASDIHAFIAFLNKRRVGGKEYRLPTDEEWEYACRAGTTTRWHFGDDEAQLGDFAWFEGNSEGKPHPVGEKLPNEYGLFDVHGNVRELTAGGILRGGQFSDEPANTHSAIRRQSANVADLPLVSGFRLARTRE